MELQERAEEEKELDDLRKVIDEQIDNLNKSNVNGEFTDLLLRHEEFEKQKGKYFSSLARSAYNIALDCANVASKSSYACELAIIHLILSRLYADIAYALIKEANLDLVIPDIIKVSISLTNFPVSINVVQKLWEISKK